MRLDGNAAFAFQIHGIQDLGLHFALLQSTADLDESVSQRRLAVIYMSNDGKIANVVYIRHDPELSNRRKSHSLTDFPSEGIRITSYGCLPLSQLRAAE